jgi:hypothetical protein
MKSANRRHNFPYLYKYLSSEGGLSVLRSQALRYSSPLLFNDPFDVPREWEGFTIDELERATLERIRCYLRGEAVPQSPSMKELLRTYAERSGGISEDQFIAQAQFFLRTQRPTQEKYLRDFEEAWRERLPVLRIACFAQEATSAAMWAHYGQAHTGIVLQFESSDERDSVSLLAEPVVYQTAKPTLPSVTEWARAFLSEIELDWDQVLREYQFVKHADWSYEREVRVVTARKATETGFYSDISYHPLDLQGVILGAKVGKETEAAIREICAAQYPHASIFRAQIDHSQRAIVINTRP